MTEKFLVSAQFEDDFVIKDIHTEELKESDDLYDPKTPYATHGAAERSDGAKCFFQFLHDAPVVNEHVRGAKVINELRIGFYLRKKEKERNKIISLKDALRN